MPALRYRAKPMTKGFTTEGWMHFAFPPYALVKQGIYLIEWGEDVSFGLKDNFGE